MNLHQFRFVREVVRRNLNLTAAAKALYTSQPGISKSILEFEDELGIEIFMRHGKRLRSVTEQGQLVIASIERILDEIEALKHISEDFAAQDCGNLVVAAAYTQARYSLPKAMTQFKQQFPQVQVTLLQGSDAQVLEMMRTGQADLALITEPAADDDLLVTLPYSIWHAVAVMPSGHPLAQCATPTLADLLAYPLVTSDSTFPDGAELDQKLASRQLAANIALRSIDADVVKTYARLGLGVGIMMDVAFDAQHDSDLCVLPIDHLFGSCTARLALRRGRVLRDYAYTLAELISPFLARERVEQAMDDKLARTADHSVRPCWPQAMRPMTRPAEQYAPRYPAAIGST